MFTELRRQQPIIPPINGAQILESFDQYVMMNPLKEEPENSLQHQGLLFKPVVQEKGNGLFEKRLEFVLGTYDYFFSL